MSERDIRAAIRQVCSDLDRRSRSQGPAASVGRVVLPLLLGAGLVGPACGSDVDNEGEGGGTTAQTGTPSGTSSGTTTGTTTGTGVGDPMPTYGVEGGWGPWGGSGGVGGQGGNTGGAATGGGGGG